MSTDASTVEALRQVDLFAGLRKRAVEKVAACAETVQHPAGMALTTAGSGGVAFHGCVRGTAEAVGDRVVRTLGPGDWFGDLALIDQQPRSATVRTTSDVETTFLAAWHSAPLLDSEPSVTKQLLLTMCARRRSGRQAASHCPSAVTTTGTPATRVVTRRTSVPAAALLLPAAARVHAQLTRHTAPRTSPMASRGTRSGRTGLTRVQGEANVLSHADQRPGGIMRVVLHSRRSAGSGGNAAVRRLGMIAAVVGLAAFGTPGTAQAQPPWKDLGPAFQTAESSSGCRNMVSPTTDTYTCSHAATVDAMTGAGTGSATVESPVGQNYPIAWAQSHMRATDRLRHDVPSISYTAVVHVHDARSRAQTGSTGGWTWSTFDIVVQAQHSSCYACFATTSLRVTGPGGADVSTVTDKEYSIVLTMDPREGPVPAGDISLQVTPQCITSVFTSAAQSASASCSYDAVVTSLSRN